MIFKKKPLLMKITAVVHPGDIVVFENGTAFHVSETILEQLRVRIVEKEKEE